MKIALVCPNFFDGRSYQENIWAEQLALMGHEVRVFHAGRATLAPVRVKTEDGGAFERQTVATRFWPRSTYTSPALVGAVEAFAPQLIVLYGDKLFCAGVVRSRDLAGTPIVSTYSENAGMHEFDWRKRGISLKQRLWAIGFVLLRGGPIRRACRRSALIVGNTPQAREILLRLFNEKGRPAIHDKIIDRPLGFSPAHFGYRTDVRARIRAELGLKAEDVALCISSQFTAVKEPYVMMIVQAVRTAMDAQPNLKAMIVGFEKDGVKGEVSRRIEAHIAGGRHASRFMCVPFAQRDRLSALYNGCDLAAFGRASISCQEALGTGLVVCFPDDGSLNHLVTRSDQGYFFKAGDRNDLSRAIGQAAEAISHIPSGSREAYRASLAAEARWLGYDRIIASILQELAQRGSVPR